MPGPDPYPLGLGAMWPCPRNYWGETLQARQEGYRQCVPPSSSDSPEDCSQEGQPPHSVYALGLGEPLRHDVNRYLRGGVQGEGLSSYQPVCRLGRRRVGLYAWPEERQRQRAHL